MKTVGNNSMIYSAGNRFVPSRGTTTPNRTKLGMKTTYPVRSEAAKRLKKQCPACWLLMPLVTFDRHTGLCKRCSEAMNTPIERQK